MSLSISLKKYHYCHTQKNSTFSFAWVLWFILCSIPFSFEGLGINYLFLFTPFIHYLFGGKLFYPTGLISLFFIICSIIFIIAIIYQVQFYEYSFRRFTSFIVFMSVFSLVIINFSQKMINSFLLSLVLVSVYFSLVSILGFISSEVADPAFLKVIIGTQRIGFFYIFALWILLETMGSYKLSILTRIFVFMSIVIVLIGIIFTFSRASYVALTGGILFALGFYFFRSHFRFTWFKNLIYIAFGISILLSLINIFLPQFYSFLDQRLFSLASFELLSDRIDNSDSSEGARVAIWIAINNFVIHNPFTGSGLLGSWVLSDFSGSAHSEFFDRYLRLGFVGFIFYLLIIYRLYRFLIYFNQALAFGFISILIYGLFHETFSQSQGAIIFSFLLMLYARHYRQSRKYP